MVTQEMIQAASEFARASREAGNIHATVWHDEDSDNYYTVSAQDDVSTSSYSGMRYCHEG